MNTELYHKDSENAFQSRKHENEKAVKERENEESGVCKKPREESDSRRKKYSIISNKRSTEMGITIEHGS